MTMQAQDTVDHAAIIDAQDGIEKSATAGLPR
jgi:hypothetical protein